MVVVFAPLAWEAWAIASLLQGRERRVQRGLHLVQGWLAGREVMVCRVGMGNRAATAAGQVLRAYLPQAALAMGLGGATVEGLGRGHIFLATAIALWDGECEPLPTTPWLVEMAQQAAQRAGLPCTTGPSCTVRAVMARPADKEEVARRLGAALVQMEDYWLAQEAIARGLPFLAIRAVADALHDHLPVTDQGRWRLSSLAGRPGAALPLMVGVARALLRLRRMALALFQIWR
jgi:nucleoside phosphorylase